MRTCSVLQLASSGAKLAVLNLKIIYKVKEADGIKFKEDVGRQIFCLLVRSLVVIKVVIILAVKKISAININFSDISVLSKYLSILNTGIHANCS